MIPREVQCEPARSILFSYVVAVYDSIWKDVEMVCQNVKGRDDSYSHFISLFLSSFNSLRKKF